jgi:hypothetical protein
LSYKGIGLAGTTRTCCLRLRRAALCPDELRRDGHAPRETGQAPKHALREAGKTPKRRRQGSNLGSSRAPQPSGSLPRCTRREWDSNPRTGSARLPPFQDGPLSSLGISPWARRWRRAGESNSQAGWSPVVRFRSGWAHRVPRPSLTVHPCCGLDQVRTGGLRLDGATGTPLPYEATSGTPPGGRTLTTGVRVRHAGIT